MARPIGAHRKTTRNGAGSGPRHADDRHFPKPVWAEAARPHAAQRAAPDRRSLARALKERLSQP